MYNMYKEKKDYALTSLKRANMIAIKANKKMYLFYIILSVIMTANVFITLSSTEFAGNSAFHLLTGSINYSFAVKGVIFYAGMMILMMGISILQRLAENKLMLDVTYYFEHELNTKLSRIKWDYYESHDTYIKIHEVRSKSLEIIKKLIQSTAFFLSFIPLACIFSYYLFQINPYAVAGYVAAILIFNRISTKGFDQLSKLWEEIQPYTQKQNYFFSMIGDKTSHQEFKFHRLFDFVSSRWDKLFGEEYKIKIKIFRKHEFLLQTSRIIMNIPYITMLIVITFEIAKGNLQIGFLLMANRLLNNIIDCTLDLQNKITNSRTESRFIKTYDEVMSLSESVLSDAKPISCNIKLRNITYTYPQSEFKALNGLDFTIQQGEKIAVVGVNGSGKTTFTNLLLSLTDNFTGSITDGKNKVNLCNSLSCVLQDFAQYQMTIKENIEVGNTKKSFADEEIISLLDQVGLKEVVLSLKNGIYTNLGQLEKGIELSKGQWQRLAIARLLANPDAAIWVLDEPTAYLDPLSEIEIYNMIYNLAGNRTVLFISHRLGFAKKANRVVLFDNGKITEQGCHDELLKKNGVYAKMYKGQENWYTA